MHRRDNSANHNHARKRHDGESLTLVCNAVSCCCMVSIVKAYRAALNEFATV